MAVVENKRFLMLTGFDVLNALKCARNLRQNKFAHG